jgi:serine/threonine protein kinase
MAEYI